MKRTLSPLTLGIAVPFVTLVLLLAAVFTPRLFSKPKYDFIYTVSGGYPTAGNYYANGDDKIIYTSYPDSTPGAIESTPQVKPSLYRYHTSTNTSEKIELDAANALTLSTTSTSPDGYQFSYSYSGSRLFGIGSYNSSNGAALEGHGVHYPLKIEQLGGSGYGSSMLLAWVTK